MHMLIVVISEVGIMGDCYFLVHASCISSCLQWTYIACKIRKKTISVFKNEYKRSEELMQIKGDLGDRLKATCDPGLGTRSGKKIP